MPLQGPPGTPQAGSMKASMTSRNAMGIPKDTVGSTHFIPHPDHVWLPGKRLSPVGDEWYTPEGMIKIAKDAETEEIKDDWVLRGVDDVCILSSVSQASLLHALRVRYNRDEIYTYISVILVAVNPFKRLPIYSTEDIELYRSAADTQALSPHVFGVAGNAFRNMIDKMKCQAILISGESGAGKTESTKFVLLYIAQVLRSDHGLEEQLLQVNPILEAFGNAKTIRNDNSSRFGKWIQITVNPSTMGLDHASVTDYLLEVSRVCMPSTEERNFHIFYQLTTDDARQEYPYLKLDSPTKYKYMNCQSGPPAEIDDFKEFEALREALTTLGFTVEQEESIFRIAAGILHLGNVEFVKEGDGCQVKNDDTLETCADVLRVDKKFLAEMMCFKRRATSAEVFLTGQDVTKAVESRNSIAKAVYKRLFEWLVIQSNKTLSAGQDGAAEKSRLFIGVLDIAGFEFFNHNSIEQLWINLSNEKLQQFFNNAIFKSELAEYEAEGIPITSINYSDNQIILDLIEGKGGLLLTLDDATLGVKLTDEKYTSKIIREHQKHAHFVKPKFVASNPLLFGVKHFAGAVMYNTHDWVVKNVTDLPIECHTMMQNSSNVVLNELAGDLDTGRHGPVAGGKKTVSSLFRKGLQALVTRLSDAEANFIRCIKPNSTKSARKYDANLVLDQLQLSGAFETVKIRQKGFLIRQPCIEFSKRYLVLLSSKEEEQVIKDCGSPSKVAMTLDSAKKAAEELIGRIVPEALQRSFQTFEPSQVAVGKTKVFIKADLYRQLEELRRERLVKPTTFIQARIRGAVARIRMKLVMDTNNGLRSCAAQAGELQYLNIESLKKNVRRASVMESTLSQMDVLLGQAAVLPIQLPRLKQFYRARAKLSAQAVAARQLSDCMVSVDVTLMEGMLARATAIDMAGELVDQVTSRRQLVLLQLQIRRSLQDAEYFDGLEDVQAVTSQAKEHKLNEEDAWQLEDGHDAWVKAHNREEALLVEQRELAEIKSKLEVRMTSLTLSFDEGALKSVLVQAGLRAVTGQVVDTLQARHDILEKEISLRDAFLSCAGSLEVAKLTEALESAQGFESPDSYLMLDIPRLQANVARSHHACRQNQVRGEVFEALRALPAISKPPVEDQLEADLFCGEDDVYLQRLRLLVGMDITKVIIGQSLALTLNSRCDELEQQINLRHLLQRCAVMGDIKELKEVLTDVQTANLEAPEMWLLPEGPRLHAVVQGRHAQLTEQMTSAEKIAAAIGEELSAMMSKLDARAMEGPLARAAAYGITGDAVSAVADRKATLEKEGRLRSKLLGCTVSESVEHIQSVVDSVQSEGFGGAQPWILVDGAELLQIARNRLDQLPGMFSLKTELQACAGCDDLERLTQALEGAKSRGLDGANHWLIAGGIDCFLAAEQRRMQLQEEQDCKDRLKADILEEMGKMDMSLDITAMVGQLARAEACGVTGEVVERIAAREKNMVQQEQLHMQLLTSNVTEGEDILKKAIADVQEANLAEAQGWLGPDCYELFQKALGRDKDLAMLLRLKAELQVGAGTANLDEVKKVVDEVIAASLEKDGFWLALGGADCLEAAKKRLADLEEQKQWQDRNTAQIVQDLEELKASLDVSAMQGPLARATAYDVDAEAFDTITKREGTLQKEAALCTQLLGSTVCENMEQLEQVIEEVKEEGLHEGGWLTPEGAELFDRVAARAQKLPTVLRIKQELEDCICNDRLDDITKVCEEAEGQGLASAENWPLSGGVASYQAADARRKQLLASKETRERSTKEVRESLQENLSSLDTAAMKGTLARAEALHVEGEDVDAVVARRATVLEQEAFRIKLLSVTLCEDPQQLGEVVAAVKEQGLEEGGTSQWLLPDGAELVKNACHRLSMVDFMAAAKSELQKCAGGTDIEVVEKVLDDARQHGLDAPENWLITGGADCWKAAAQRHEQLKQEKEREEKVVAEINGLLDGLMSSLDDSVMGGILARAGAHDIEGDRVDAVKARKETLARQRVVRANLLECLVCDDMDLLADVDRMAKEGDLHQPETWLLPDGAELYAKLADRLEKLPILADIRAQLQACAGSTDPEKIRSVLEEARQNGLDKTENWLMSTGPACFDAVLRMQAEHKELKAAADAAVAEILEQEQAAMQSLHVQLLRGWLANATAHAVDTSRVTERMEELERQEEIYLQLLCCQVVEDTGALEQTVSMAKEAGLEDAGKWVFSDGADILQSIKRRIEKLPTVLRMKQELIGCTGSEDLPKVNQVVEEARGLGLDQAENWLLSNGIAIFEAVCRRQEQLVKEKEQEDQLALKLQQQLDAMLMSLDPALMSGFIARAADQNSSGRTTIAGTDAEALASVIARKDTLEKQDRLSTQLHKCTVSEDVAFLEQVITEVKAAELDQKENWLLPDALARFSIAADRQKKMEMMLRLKAELRGCAGSATKPGGRKMTLRTARTNVVEELQVVSKSIDTAKENGLDVPENWMVAGGADCWTAARRRQDELTLLAEQWKRDKDSVMAQLLAVKAELRVSPLLGPVACAEAYGIFGPEVDEVSQRREALSRQHDVRALLLGGVVTESMESIESVLSEAKGAQLDEPARWLLPDGAELFEQVSSRLGKLPLLLRIHADLQACAGSDDLAKVTKVFEEVQSNTLGNAVNFFSVGGADCWGAVVSRKAVLDEKEQSEKGIREEITQYLGQLGSSGDTLAMKACLARAGTYSVSGQAVDDIAARKTILDRQLELRTRLLVSTVAEQEEQISSVLAEISEEGLDDASKWIATDGAAILTKVTERKSKLPFTLRVLSSLRDCVPATDLETVRKGVAEALGNKLDSPDTWIITGGHASWTAAQSRLQELEEAKQQLDGMKAALTVKLNELLGDSADVTAMLALLPQLKAFEVENAEALQTKIDKLGIQQPILELLRECVASHDVNLVTVALTQASEAGLDDESNWIMLDGPKLQRRAANWKDKLEAVKPPETEGFAKVIDALKVSVSVPLIEGFLDMAQNLAFEDGGELKERAAALKAQAECRRELLGTGLKAANLKAGASKAEACGLAAAETSLFSDGVKLFARARKLAELLPKKPSAPTGLGGQDAEHFKKLLQMLDSADAGAVRAAAREVRLANLGSDAWTAAAGPELLELCELWREHLLDREADVDVSQADLQLHSDAIQTLLKHPISDVFVGADISAEIAAHTAKVLNHAELREALRSTLFGGVDHAMADATTQAEEAGLGAADKWLLPEGPGLLTVAQREAEWQQLLKAAHTETISKLEADMQVLMATLDVPPISGFIAHTEKVAVDQALRGSLIERCETLKVQGANRFELTQCSTTLDLAVVRETLGRLREVGLDSPAKWLLLDGPKLWTRAIDKQDQLTEIDRIKQVIETTATKFDAKGLMSAMRRARDLGVAEEDFGWADKLFVELQDEKFVEGKSQELQKSGGSDTTNLVMVSNLEDQLRTLGFDFNASGMKAIARQMTADFADNDRSAFDSANATELALAEKAYSEVRNFDKLRDPLDFGGEGTDPNSLSDSMLSFSKSPITKSLLVLDEEKEKKAISLFQDILRSMGDTADPSSAQKQTPIIEVAKLSDDLCDEVYCQVMKQLTSNPSAWSEKAGWELFRDLMNEVLPTRRLRDFVRGFLLKSVQDTGSQEEQAIQEGPRRVISRQLTLTFYKEQRPQMSREVLGVFLGRMASR